MLILWLKFVNKILEDTGNAYMWREQRNITKFKINQAVEDNEVGEVPEQEGKR